MSVVRAIPLLLLTGCVAAPTVGEHAEALFTNDQAALDFFVGKGLTDFQAAGIVGNFDVESGVDPTAVQSGGPGRGIAQWLKGGRWDTTSNDNAVDYAATLGESVETLDAQLQFTWYELTTFSSYGLSDLQGTTSVSGATISFMSHFEGCSACSSGTRVQDAENVLAAFGNDKVDFAGTHIDSGVACTINSGETGVCIDTSACAALGDHVSTPGFCPGAANIECCTSSSGSDGGSSTHKKSGCDATGSGAVDGTISALLALFFMRRRRTI